VRRAIRTHLRDFIAIIALAVLAIAVGGVLLVQQRASFPDWVPGIGKERFELRAAFRTAKAVTAGQGQIVNIAGVKVGDVTGVELSDGEAVITMAIDKPYDELIHPDASMLLRPRSPLQDMTIEVDPGTSPGSLSDGDLIPLAQTDPNVNVDEILASLDADTRSYLKLLLNGAAQGLEGRSLELSAGLRRFEPLTRDLARVTGAVAKRRGNVRRVIHNFRLLAEEVGRGEQQLTGFVDSSNAVLGAFAEQEAALRDALRELPGTLSETRAALQSSSRLSRELEPALRDLLPGAKALGPSLRETTPFLRQTRLPIRDQLRPVSRQIRKPVKHLKQAADPLAQTTGGLKSGIKNLNRLLNVLAFNPSGSEEGYLFWLSWLNHNTNSLFTLQDANGPLRRGLVLLTCQTAGLAEGVTAARPFLLTAKELSRLPTTDEIC
jgi:phospholipid/cholesterol/gamma-HCH transport system substrate-binding protein